MINIGIVGAGIIAESHAKAIMKNPDCTLTMVADIVSERARAIAKPFDALVFEDYRDFCKDGNEKPDVVILNLPHYLHCEASVYFLSQKVNVLVEKPMAMNVEECDTMIEAAKTNGVKLAIGHVQQYFNAHTVIKDVIKNNTLGKLLRITGLRNTNYFENRPEWFWNKELSGGGIVMNYCAHTLDKIFYMTGSHMESVYSYITNFCNGHSIEEGAQILAGFSDGFSVSLNYTGSKVHYDNEMIFYFEKGEMKTIGGDVYKYENGMWNLIKIEYPDIMECQISAMVDWYNGKESRITNPEHGRKVIEALQRIYSSNIYSESV